MTDSPLRATAARTLVVLIVAVLGGVLTGAAPAAAAPPDVPDFGPGIEPFPGEWTSEKGCDDTPQPGTAALQRLITDTWGAQSGFHMGRACSPERESGHDNMRALDWMVHMRNSGQRQVAEEYIDWLLATDRHGNRFAMARRLGVMYIVWADRMWRGYGSRAGTWSEYDSCLQPAQAASTYDTTCHRDHVHVSLTPAGAAARTSFYTARPKAPAVSSRRALVADVDGDRRPDVGWFDAGVWSFLTAAGREISFSFGTAGDVPVVGDWSRSGRDGVGVFRDGQWHLRSTASGGAAQTTFSYGTGGDVPLVGRWPGAGRDGIAVVRDGRWHLRSRPSAGFATTSFSFGITSDAPAAGDWTGSRVSYPGILRDGVWHLATSVERPTTTWSYSFGRAGDTPVVGDWDGNRSETAGVARGSTFYGRDSHSGGPATYSRSYAG